MSGGATIGSILSGSSGADAIKVFHHLSAQTADRVKGDAPPTDATVPSTLTPTTGGMGLITITRAHSLNGTRATTLRRAHPGLTLTGFAGGQALDGDLLTSGVKVGGDGEQVVGGSGHRLFVELRVVWIGMGVLVKGVWTSPPTVLRRPYPGPTPT